MVEGWNSSFTHFLAAAISATAACAPSISTAEAAKAAKGLRFRIFIKTILLLFLHLPRLVLSGN